MIRKSDKLLIITTFLLLIILILSFINFPYYVTVGGGITEMNNNYIKTDNESESKGSYNITFVKEAKTNIPLFLLAHIIPNWEISKIEDYKYNDFETANDIDKRDKMELNIANATAIKNAYLKAGKYYKVTETNIEIAALSKKDSKLKIGDILLKMDNTKIDDIEDVSKIIKRKNINDIVKIEIKRNNKTITINETIKLDKETNRKILGIYYITTRKYDTNPKTKITFKASESGPSAGLIVALSIYDKLVEEDLTKGLKIVGTGTIDYDGNVGSIGGVKYKLQGAVKSKADVFIVPDGDNYKECVKLKEKYNYKIKLIPVKTFDDAVDKLRNLEK
ncbi:MAG: PDZ domain-containing protein [Bacilli bacterium]|nr:PDZ domain-containing protein [Bacilli bacterium]